MQIILIGILMQLVVGLERCRKFRVRREIRELNELELQRYIKATQILHTSNPGLFRSQFGYNFGRQFSKVHHHPQYLPWHRILLAQYEQALKQIDPAVDLPFWDWSLDSQFPHDSGILTKNYVGGNGESKTRCLKDGPFKEITTPVVKNQKVVGNKCIQRRYNLGDEISSFVAPEILEAAINEPKFSDFSFQIEAYHGHVLDSMGELGSYNGIYDPLFFLSHNFMDLIWSKWQDNHPNINLYEGERYGKEVNLDENLPGFNNISIKDTLFTRSYPYCYEYLDYPRLIPLPEFNNQEQETKNDEDENDINEFIQKEFASSIKAQSNRQDLPAPPTKRQNHKLVFFGKALVAMVQDFGYSLKPRQKKLALSKINRKALVAMEAYETLNSGTVNAIQYHPWIGVKSKAYENLSIQDVTRKLQRETSIQSFPLRSKRNTPAPKLNTLELPSMYWSQSHQFTRDELLEVFDNANRLISVLNRYPSFQSLANIHKGLELAKMF